MYTLLPTGNAAWRSVESLIVRASQAVGMPKAGHRFMAIWSACFRRNPWARGSHFEATPFVYGSIGRSEQRQFADTAKVAGLAQFKPWREVGWIFRDGGCIAIERQGPLSRAREVVG